MSAAYIQRNSHTPVSNEASPQTDEMYFHRA